MMRLNEYKKSEFAIDHVELKMDLTKDPVIVNSKLTVRSDGKKDQPLILDGKNISLKSIKVNGEELKLDAYIKTESSLTLLHVPKGPSFTVEIENSVINNTDLFGPYKTTQGTYLVKAETEGFRRLTYFLDRPDVMATYQVTLVADEKRYPTLLSNGKKINEEKFSDGTHRVTWQDLTPKPSYLFAMVADDLECLKDEFKTQSGRVIPLEIYVKKGNAKHCHFVMHVLKKAMEWEEKKYGKECELTVHRIVGADDYAAGASEPTNLNIFNSKFLMTSPAMKQEADYFLVAEVVAHEFFHYRSGGLTTIENWFELAYKEGLTTLRTHLFLEDFFGKDIIRSTKLNELSLLSSYSDEAIRPASYTNVRSLYTPLVYEKAAEVFRMLLTEMGEGDFYRGQNLFFEQYRLQATNIDSFISTLDKAKPGCDLEQFIAWIERPGAPSVGVNTTYTPESKTYVMELSQSSKRPDDKPMPIPIQVKLFDEKGQEIPSSTQHDILSEEKKVYHFSPVQASKVVPSFSGSCPLIKVKHAYSIEDLRILMMHDTDLTGRYIAGKHYLLKQLLAIATHYRHTHLLRLPDDFIETYRALLIDSRTNPWLLADMMTLPLEKTLLGEMTEPNFDIAVTVLEFVSTSIANLLRTEFETIYQKNKAVRVETDVEFDTDVAGLRRLKNMSLMYLAQNDPASYKNPVVEQFNASLTNNMTDTYAALAILVNMECPEKQVALNQFYEQWKKFPIVMGYWLRLQASAHIPTVIDDVRALMKHEAFNIRNPTIIYTLVGAFSKNPYGLHALSGKGYPLMSELIIALDGINPTVGASVTRVLTDLENYDEKRQGFMFKELKYLESVIHSSEIKEVIVAALKKYLDKKMTSPQTSQMDNGSSSIATAESAVGDKKCKGASSTETNLTAAFNLFANPKKEMRESQTASKLVL